MSNYWEPTEEKDLTILLDVAKRHFEVLTHKERLQYEQIIKIVEKYKANGMISLSPDKKASIEYEPHYDEDTFIEYEYLGTDDEGQNIYQQIYAILGRGLNWYGRLYLAKIKSPNKPEDLNIKAGEWEPINWFSPFGGATEIYSDHKDYERGLCDYNDNNGWIGYYYRYPYNGENYWIEQFNTDNSNSFYGFDYFKKEGDKEVLCGAIGCKNGAISVAKFKSEEDFKAICELYKQKDISRISDKCTEHVNTRRSLI